MNNIPSVLATLLCDWIIVEQGTAKKTLVGLFDSLNSSSFPTLRPIGFYARLTDLEGHYHFTLRIVRLDGEKEELMAGAEFEYKADDPLGILEIALNLPSVPFTTPGRYEFQLYTEDIYVGRAVLNVATQPYP
jgi:hypothetical protein